MDDPVQWALAIASFMLALFALGAPLGWRWEARHPKVVPVWIWASMETAQLLFIVWLAFFSALPWLTAFIAVLWIVNLALEVRTRLTSVSHAADDALVRPLDERS